MSRNETAIYGGAIMRNKLCYWFLTLVVAVGGLLVSTKSATAQVLGNNVYDPWTGRVYGGVAGYNPYIGQFGQGNGYYNPWNGAYGRSGAGYSPFTGLYTGTVDRYNPYTGRTYIRERAYNPWTNQYGWRNYWMPGRW